MTDATTPKTARITLNSPGSRLTLMAVRRADGTATTFATTLDVESKKTTRGMSAKHETFDTAKAAIAKQAQDAEKVGWSRRAPSAGRGFVARPDGFSTIPPAPKSKHDKFIQPADGIVVVKKAKK